MTVEAAPTPPPGAGSTDPDGAVCPAGEPRSEAKGTRRQPKRYREIAPHPPEGQLHLPELVPGTGPLEVDVGFGRGMSLFERAKAAPSSRLLGIEIKMKWATVVAARVERLELGGRVKVLAGDAKDILGRSGPDGCVRRAFVHFPDPWWKKRHQKRRVVGAELLDTFGRLFLPGGELFIQTDVEARAVEYVAQLGAHPAFELATPTGLIDDNPFGSVSNRERRAAEDGLPVFRILARASQSRNAGTPSNT